MWHLYVRSITYVFFDLEKAYDTAWRFGILETLHNYEFCGELPLFIKAFLRNRKFSS